MLFGLFKAKEKPKQRWREYVGEITPFLTQPMLTSMLLQKANDLGLQGKRITVSVRFADQIWFEGETK